MTGFASPARPLTRRRFWVNWFAWNALGGAVALVLKLLLLLWTANGLTDQPALVQSWSNILVFIAGAVAVAWAQQRALRGQISNLRQWFLLTAMVGALVTLLGLSGTYQSLLRQNNALYPVFVQEHALEDMLMTVLAIFGGGLAMGLVQWLVLRLELRRAALWVAWTAGAWLVYTLSFSQVQKALTAAMQAGQLESLGGLTAYRNLVVGLEFIFSLLIPLIAGVGLARLLVPQAGRPALEDETREDVIRKNLVLRLVGATIAAWLGYQVLMGLGGSELLALLQPASTASPSSAGVVLAGLLPYFLEGLIVGLAQAWALGSSYRRRWTWAFGTTVAFMLQGFPLLTEVLRPVLDWSVSNFNLSPGLLYVYVYKAATGLEFWVVLGIIQALFLWQWAGRRAWIWFLVVPAVELVGLLAELLFGLNLNVTLRAAAYGYLLTFVLRAGWAEELTLLPEGKQPSAEDLDFAAHTLLARLQGSFGLKAQMVVEDGSLLLSLANSKDTEFAVEVAQQQGLVQVVRAEGSLLEIGKPLPAGTVCLLTADDIRRARPAGKSGLDLELFEEGWNKVSSLVAAYPGAGLALAVDGEVISQFTPELSKPGQLVVTGMNEDDASYYAAILSNDPLPFTLKLAVD